MTTAHRTHRLIAGCAMVLAPLLLLVSGILQPSLKSSEVAQLLVVRSNLNEWFATQAFMLGALALAVPAVLGLMHMLRERQPAIGNIGGGLALIGILASVGTVTINVVAWEMMRFGLPIPAVAAVLHDAKSVAGMKIPYIILPFAFAAGVAVLAGGLALVRAQNPAVAAAIAVGAILVPIAFAVSSVTLLIVGAAILVVGFGTTGLFLLRETDADWEHTPVFRGFRPTGPAAGA
jgi:hypothetical protein